MTAMDNHRAVAPKPGKMTTSALANVVRGDVLYPARLSKLSNPPQSLWVLGQLPDFGCQPDNRGGNRDFSSVASVSSVAIVGSRAATAAGCERTRDLARALAQTGIVVVSGGAFGIDAAAHEGTLAAGGITLAVLGCGVDVTYPDRHAPLFSRIAGRGALLSEYPPGTPPRPGQFPARNRIIAALVDLVVVVQAAHRSGALSTAKAARTLGIPVAALPGSGGTDTLIGRGQAFAVEDPADVFAVLAGNPRSPLSAAPAAVAVPTLDEGGSAPAPETVRLLNALFDAPLGANALARRLGWPVSRVLGVVGEAEIEGWIRRVPGGAYEVTRGH